MNPKEKIELLKLRAVQNHIKEANEVIAFEFEKGVNVSMVNYVQSSTKDSFGKCVLDFLIIFGTNHIKGDKLTFSWWDWSNNLETVRVAWNMIEKVVNYLIKN